MGLTINTSGIFVIQPVFNDIFYATLMLGNIWKSFSFPIFLKIMTTYYKVSSVVDAGVAVMI